MPPIELQVFKIKITTVRKYNSILSICRRSWSLFRRHSVGPFPHSVAPLSLSVAPFRHFALYPHRLTHRTRTFRRTILATFCRTTSAHFGAPNLHISSHRSRSFCSTVQRDIVAKRGSVKNLGLFAKLDTVSKTRGSVAKRVNLQSRGKSEEDNTHDNLFDLSVDVRSCSTASVVRRPRQIAEILN